MLIITGSRFLVNRVYKKYLKERCGLDVLQTETGFVTYRFRGPDCYIEDIYVLPEFRQVGLAEKMADKVAEIAKEAGINILTGSVDSRANGAEISRQVLRGYGMHPYTQEGSVTYYRKEL